DERPKEPVEKGGVFSKVDQAIVEVATRDPGRPVVILRRGAGGWASNICSWYLRAHRPCNWRCLGAI
ncbi:MAG: hypothetical protein WA948_13605, partial [Pontixanthobacter sp.]